MRIWWLALCAGCVPSSVEASGSGLTTGLVTQTISCGTSATVDRYAAGAGDVAITVFDGDHHPVFDDGANVSGEVDDTRDVDGVPGTWRLTVDPQGLAGQFKITLSCL